MATWVTLDFVSLEPYAGVCRPVSRSFLVLSSLIKSPYKTCLLNIPCFMRVRKRFDAEKIVKLGDYLDAKALSIKDCSFREIPFFVAILRQFALTIFCISVMVAFAFAVGNP